MPTNNEYFRSTSPSFRVVSTGLTAICIAPVLALSRNGGATLYWMSIAVRPRGASPGQALLALG